MLLFNDYRKMILDGIAAIYSDVRETDLTLDRSGHGDLTLRAFSLMKSHSVEAGKLAEDIKKELLPGGYIESIEVLGGYINFRLSTAMLMKAISAELDGTGRYPDVFQDPERVSVEHTSTNPTGPIHIGRIRNSIIGDALAKLLQRYGYRVTTQYFINDSGRQVASLYAGYRRFAGNKPLTTENLLKAYQEMHQETERNPDAEKDVDQVLREYESGNPQIMDSIRNICSVILGSINSTLEKLGIRIDDYTWESDFIRNGDVKKVLEQLSEHIREEDGALYVQSGDRKMFLTRNDGTSLYFSRDIAYHLYKMENFDWIIDVLGENHKEHARHIKYVMKNLLEKEARMDFVFYSYVSLETGKMTTRGGNIVTADELIDRAREEALSVVKAKRPDLPEDRLQEIANAVAVSAVRFHIGKLNANKQMVFKWSEALSLEGDSAPFIMYSYARAASILRKAQESRGDLSSHYDECESRLIKKMYLYPYALQEAVFGLKPEVLANYLLELTRTFNDFYSTCPVISAPDEERNRRIYILRAYTAIVKDAGTILGIRMLEEM